MFEQCKGQISRNHWWVTQFFKQKWRCANMVQMSMCKYHTTNLFFFAFQILHVWNNVINSRHVFFGKLQPHVYNHNILTIFKNSHVAANFFTPSNRNNTQCFFFNSWNNWITATTIITIVSSFRSFSKYWLASWTTTLFFIKVRFFGLTFAKRISSFNTCCST